MANEQESTENKKNHAQPGTERSKSKGKGKKLDIWGNKGKSGKGEAQSASDKENIRSQKGPENEGVEHKSSIRERFKTWKENLGDETASSEAKDLHALGSEKEGIFVETAGLVLLNPYMKPFFAHLGLLETDYQFKSKRDQVHAVYLLHYLATGSPEVPQEPELVFAKILTGLPWSQPLDLISMPTATEREEADSMLETVINYWTAVGNIKPQTLRKQFLDRPGKITRDPNGWLLQVEEAAYDILLDRLPWNIGMIRLPWLEDMIHVRWRN